ncbi:protein of unknown function [Taphrina deformans PYCC 5710]|uniref:Dolichyldiphosphatase n=1 Tax=Taphrina deformans (strain PYCC 5710 / ATCC 11124 / CBS 356.35 / IMI 108563 / JCM 9778 / NBRC 8474) TaxID=1097556 RepID=R4XNF8_TAPDE|nr:protein of unknown function [Taphrina deformans PYCC 5710]|eukprot:CCG84779.1 protein of unknown function [Taphrina deformans PYCC 5710]
MHMPSDSELASLALTHVYYNPKDILGLPSALLALLPQALVVAYVVAIYTRREVEVCWMFAGQLSCEAFNWILKRIIKQDRPYSVAGIGKGYGMPSSHSQFMAFFGTYIVLYVYLRCINSPVYWRMLRVLGVVSTSVAVCVSRIYLTYHTRDQVMVGVAIGTMYGILWYNFFNIMKYMGLVDWTLDQPIARYFWLKDTIIDDALPREWQLWNESRVDRNKKIS